MAFIRGENFYVHFTAWDTNNLVRASGDAANMTAYVIIDDSSPTVATNSITETDVAGEYMLELTSTETDGELITVSVVSTTPGVYVETVRIATTTSGESMANEFLNADISTTTSDSVGEAIKFIRQAAVGKKVVTKDSATHWTIEIYDTDDTTLLKTITIDISGDTYTRQ